MSETKNPKKIVISMTVAMAGTRITHLRCIFFIFCVAELLKNLANFDSSTLGVRHFVNSSLM